MATRIYTKISGTVGVTPSTWNFANQINPVTVPGTTIKNDGSTMTSKVEATGTTSPINRAMGRTIIGPLGAQTITGTVKGQMRGTEANAGANATLALAIKIVQPGGTDRGVLLAQTASDNAAAPNELTTTLTNSRFCDAAEATSITLTSQAVTSGDYLVIEWGFRSATTTTRNITLSYGNNSATDLAEDTSTTAANNPWWEFTHNIVWLVTGATIATTEAINLPTVIREQAVTGNTIPVGSAAITGHVLTPVVSGQTIYSTARVLYTETLLLEVPPAAGGYQVTQSGAGRNYSQTISGHTGVLTSVSLDIVNVSSAATDSAYLVIRDSTFDGTILDVTVAIAAETVPATHPTWVNFPLLRGVPLNAGTTYWIQLYLTRLVAGGPWWRLNGSNDNPYAGGEAKDSTGATAPPGAGRDLAFRLYTGTSHTITPGAVTETGATIGVGSVVYEPTVVADAAGGITLVAEVSAAPGVSGGTSAAIDTTGATFLAMSVAWYAGPGPAVPSDSKGNAWVPLTSATYTSYQQQIFYSLGPTVGTGHTFTISGVGTYPAFFVYAYSGVGSYQTESGAGNTTSPIPSGSVTPSADGALILTGKCGSQVTTDSVTPGGSTLDSIPAAANNVQGSAAYCVQPTAAAVNPTWSWTGGTSGAYLVTSAVFLPGEPAQAITAAAITVNRTLAVNDFPAEDGFDIGLSWQDFLGGHMCWGYECVPQATNVFNNSSWNAYPGSEFDLWSQLEVRAMDGQSYGGPTVRQGSDIDNSWYAYVVNYGSSGTQGGLGAARPTSLLKCVAGTVTQLGSSVNVTLNVGDTIRVEAEGTTIRGKHNGVTIISVTDSALTDGNPGILTFYDDSPGGRPAWDNWAGGDFVQEGTSQAFAPTLPLLVHGAFIEPNLTDYSWLNHPVYATEESASFDSIVGESWSEYVGQEFTVGSAERLASIDLRSQCYGTPIDNVFVEIRSGGRDGTVIATSVAVSPLGAPDFGTVSAFLNFPFTTPVALSPGTVYAWVAKRDGAADITNQFVIMECYLTSAGEPPGRVDYTNGILIWDGDAPGWDDGYADTYSFEYRLLYAPTIYAPTVALAGGALAKVQSTAKASVTNGFWITITFATPPTVGNGIVIPVAFHAVGPNYENRIGSAIDSNGNYFAVAVSRTSFFGNTVAVILYLPRLAVVTAPYSVTFDFNAFSANATAMGVEVGNVDQGLIVDVTTSQELGGSAYTTGSSPAATVDTLLDVALYSSWGSNSSLVSSTVESVTPVWFEEFEELLNTKPQCEADTRVVTGQTGLTQSCSWTTFYVNPAACVLAAFKTSNAPVVVTVFITNLSFLNEPTVVGGAPTRAGHTNRTAGTGSGVLVSWSSEFVPVVGQGIVISFVTYDATGVFNGTATCTDSEGNVLTQAATVASAGQTRCTVYYWPRLASVGFSYNVWVDFGMGVSYVVGGINVNNVVAGLAVDTVGGSFTNSVTTTTPSVTGTAATVDSLFDVVVVGSNGSQDSIVVESVTPPWIQTYEELSFTAAIGETDCRTRIGQTGLTQGASWTFGTARPHASLTVGFKGLEGVLTPLRIQAAAQAFAPGVTGGAQPLPFNRSRTAAVRYPVVRKRDPFFG